MPDVILIADDLTGAADSAAPFASHGMSARLVFDRASELPAGVTALTTDSRDLPVHAARSAVAQACRWVAQAGGADHLLFKKIDSTLRGHLLEELEIVIAQFRIERLLLSPAFPAQGRTTLGARQHVHGIPLSQSSFATERTCDDLARLFDGLSGLPYREYRLDAVRGDTSRLRRMLARPGVHVPDIETDADMERCVDAALEAGVRGFAGAGGLGRALAYRTGPRCAAPPGDTHLSSATLIVAGSRNQTTLNQVDAALRAGTPVVPLSMEDDDWERTVTGHLQAGTSAIVSSVSAGLARETPETIREQLGRGVERVIARSQPGSLILTGGDVAAAVCQSLGVRAISLRGELEPGIPVGTLEGGDASGLTVVTKAGGFGDRDAFRRLLGSVGRQ